MRRIKLTEREKLTLYGITRFPSYTNRELSEQINLSTSTIASIRRRLYKNGYFKPLNVPMVQNLGCELLAIIYTNFNPISPLEERINVTGKTIEVFEEIFLSIGERDRGFSLSFSRDYTTIGKINDIRTEIFGKRELLEDEYPNMVLFPFDISKIYRFFDFSSLLGAYFGINDERKSVKEEFERSKLFNLSDSEKKVYAMLIKHPNSSDAWIGSKIGVSRHTVSKMKRKFRESNLLKRIIIPNVKKLGFEILAFYHISFDPKNPPDVERNENALLMNDYTVFMATRKFEAVMLSFYANYDEYSTDRTRIFRLLREKNWITDKPVVKSYSLRNMAIIKDFTFDPLVRKILS
ncbi:MAG TPA: winged helix-turn-helix transcriptional regulator [Thermoplasmatales archaeon]|nr:winged helix-turn-helix transcriptional regulator [Thermoplasmatales archaeon]